MVYYCNYIVDCSSLSHMFSNIPALGKCLFQAKMKKCIVDQWSPNAALRYIRNSLSISWRTSAMSKNGVWVRKSTTQYGQKHKTTKQSEHFCIDWYIVCVRSRSFSRSRGRWTHHNRRSPSLYSYETEKWMHFFEFIWSRGDADRGHAQLTCTSENYRPRREYTQSVQPQAHLRAEYWINVASCVQLCRSPFSSLHSIFHFIVPIFFFFAACFFVASLSFDSYTNWGGGGGGGLMVRNDRPLVCRMINNFTLKRNRLGKKRKVQPTTDHWTVGRKESQIQRADIRVWLCNPLLPHSRRLRGFHDRSVLYSVCSKFRRRMNWARHERGHDK